MQSVELVFVEHRWLREYFVAIKMILVYIFARCRQFPYKKVSFTCLWQIDVSFRGATSVFKSNIFSHLVKYFIITYVLIKLKSTYY